MARDRQRAKQRRKRQERSGNPARGAGARARAPRDSGLDDASVEDAGLGYTPAPDPLKHASSSVDEAKLAEAGAVLPGYEPEYEDEGEDTLERAPDEVERDLVPVRETSAEHGDQHAAVPRPHRGRVLSFLRHSVDELRRVQWPNRRQVGQATAVVLGFVVLAGGYLGLLDALWKPIIDAIL